MTLEELRKLGLATQASKSQWRALPLLEVVNHLKAQRFSEIELASVAAESLESHLLAAQEDEEDGVKILIGREAIVEAHRELLAQRAQGDLRVRQAALRHQSTSGDRGAAAHDAGVAGAGARRRARAVSTIPVSIRTGSRSCPLRRDGANDPARRWFR